MERGARQVHGEFDRLGLYANVAARLAEHAVTVEDRVAGFVVYAERVLTSGLPDRGVRAVGCGARSRRSNRSAANRIRSWPRCTCGACGIAGSWSG